MFLSGKEPHRARYGAPEGAFAQGFRRHLCPGEYYAAVLPEDLEREFSRDETLLRLALPAAAKGAAVAACIARAPAPAHGRMDYTAFVHFAANAWLAAGTEAAGRLGSRPLGRAAGAAAGAVSAGKEVADVSTNPAAYKILESSYDLLADAAGFGLTYAYERAVP